MSGKHRKVFDGKYFVMIDRPLGPKSGKIVFFDVDDLDKFQREYEEVTIDNIVFPTTLAPPDMKKWFLLSKIKFKKFKLLRPKLFDGRLEFDYEAEDGHEECLNPWQDYFAGKNETRGCVGGDTSRVA